MPPNIRNKQLGWKEARFQGNKNKSGRISIESKLQSKRTTSMLARVHPQEIGKHQPCAGLVHRAETALVLLANKIHMVCTLASKFQLAFLFVSTKSQKRNMPCFFVVTFTLKFPNCIFNTNPGNTFSLAKS